MSEDLKDLSIEELLNLMQGAEETEEKTIFTSDTTIQRFIKDMKVVPGQTKVPAFIIYYYYCRKWSNQGKKISKIGFFREFKKHFTQKRMNNMRYYLIEDGVFDQSPEMITHAKKYNTGYNNRIKRKKVNSGKKEEKEDS